MADLQTCNVRTAPTLSTQTVRLLELNAATVGTASALAAAEATIAINLAAVAATAAENLAAGLVTVLQFVSTVPLSDTDFSMFGGGIAPSVGMYRAAEPTKDWVFVGGWSAWRHSVLALSS